MSEFQAPSPPMEISGAQPSDPAPAGAAAPPAPTVTADRWQPSQGQMFDPRHKSPLLAAAVSMMPGVGQFYIGYYARGFTTAASFLTVVAIAATTSDDVIGPMIAFSAMFLWIFNMIDAGRMAAMYNHAAAGGEVMQMPEDFKLPKMGGSIVGGAALLLFGGIALSHTAFNYQLDWLEDWWPAFPLAMGVYLFARGALDLMDGNQPTSSRRFDEDGSIEE